MYIPNTIANSNKKGRCSSMGKPGGGGGGVPWFLPLGTGGLGVANTLT